MTRPRPVSLDYHLIGDGGDELDRENSVAQDGGSDNSITPDASLLSADALVAEAVNMAAIDHELAGNLLNIVPVGPIRSA